MAFMKQFCASIIVLFLCLSVAEAQSEKEDEEGSDAAQYRSAPEVQSYAALGELSESHLQNGLSLYVRKLKIRHEPLFGFLA